MPKYTIERKSTDCIAVRCGETWGPGDEQWFLLQADVHWDNPHCVRRLYKKHLDQAIERDAGIFKFGDTFCAMQGNFDKRSSKESLRPEHQSINYFDALVDTAAEYHEPYKSHHILISEGNHETSIIKHHETNLVKRLASKLNVEAMGYTGFVRFLFTRKTGGRASRVAYFNHGYGGGGPVTKGVIQSNRRAVFLPDADFVVTGHIHERWDLSIPRLRVNAQGRTYLDEQVHIQLPTYKDEYNMAGGWHIERGGPPKPLGATWLRFFYDTDFPQNIGFEVIGAR